MISDRLSEIRPLLETIARAQAAAAAGLRPRLPAADADGRRLPLLAPGEIDVDRDAFARLLRDIVAALRDWMGEDVPDGGGEVPGVDDAGLRALLEASIKGNGELERRAEAFGLDGEVFASAARYAFAPFLGAYARGLRDGLADAGDLPGRCPVCGSAPAMAEFDAEDGHRRLSCGLCGTAWRFARLKCPFCGTDDQEKLGFLEVEGLDGVRADVCESCGKYVKTVDRRKVDAAVGLEEAGLVTPELDEAASSFLEERRQAAGKS